MTQTTLWLLPLVLGALFGIVTALKMGFAWSRGLIAQHSIVLIIALVGLYFLPDWDWLFAWLGWLFMLSYTVGARLLLVKMTQALGLLRLDQAISKARQLRFLLWGPPGQFWLDLANLINFYLRHDTRSADTIYKKWQDFGLPRPISDSLAAYAMLGLLVMRDWQTAAEKYEETRRRYEEEKASGKKDARFPYQVAVPAIRALNELGRYAEARDALVLCDLAACGYSRESLETIFLSFFAMIGSEIDLDNLVKTMKCSKAFLPEHARLYWQARCAAEAGNYEKSLAIFAESLRKTPEKDTAWRERTQYQIELARQKMLSGPGQPDGQPDLLAEEKGRSAATARELMKRCFAVSDILASRKPPHAVRVLTCCISVMFFCSCYPYLMNENTSFVYNFGYLSGDLVLSGQWWRLLTYLFLHGGISHLAMNLFGLVWFGRFVENIYGSRRFLVIFFVSGILSGALQMLISQSDRAVGASGAILGVFGAGIAAMLRLKQVLPAGVRRRELGWMLALAVTQLVFDQVVNFLFPVSEAAHNAVRIAAAAHFGGMVSGFALGWILPMKKLDTDKQ
jgi:membrane associated rhomboid family serine protease